MDDSGKIVVSVFMMAYNHEKYIAQAIESVLMQRTDFRYQIVLGEDFSTDKTKEIVVSYADKNPGKFKLILHKKNVGAVSNQTAILNACTGEYIAFCEADDYWTDPLKLQKQVKLLEANPECSMCVAKTEILEHDKRVIIVGNGDKEKYGFMDILNGPYFHTSTYLIKKGFLDKYLAADRDLISGDTSLRYFLSDLGPFILLNEIVSVYRITGNGVWTSLDEIRKLKSHINLHNSYYKKFRPKYRKNFSSILINEHFELFKISIKNSSVKSLMLSLEGLLIGLFRNPKYFVSFFRPKLKKIVNLFFKLE